MLAPVSSEQGEPWDTVEVIEVRTAAAKDVAHSAWPDGLINWVATTGDWIGWTDQSAEQGDGATNVLWRIHVRNLATGETKVLASNGDSPNAFVPVLQAEDGYFFWTEPEEDRSARELVWRPGDITAHAILRHTEMTPGSASIAGDKLIYLGPNGRGLDGHTTGGDCWQVSLAGGSPSPITHTALAMACAARGDRIVWTQHIDPDTPTPPADGIYDDPYSIWSVGMDTTSEPVQLHTGYNSTYQLALTDHALVWQKQSGKAVVADLTDPRDQIPLASRAPRRLAAGPGDLAAFATVRGARVTVTVMHIV